MHYGETASTLSNIYLLLTALQFATDGSTWLEIDSVYTPVADFISICVQLLAFFCTRFCVCLGLKRFCSTAGCPVVVFFSLSAD